MKIKVEITAEEAKSILTTALESGMIDYWVGQYTTIQRDSQNMVKYVGIEEEDDAATRHIINPVSIQIGVSKVFQPGFEISRAMLASIIVDAKAVDGETADCIIQAALFGELKYG